MGEADKRVHKKFCANDVMSSDRNESLSQAKVHYNQIWIFTMIFKYHTYTAIFISKSPSGNTVLNCKC